MLTPAFVDPRAVLLQGDCVHLGSLLAPNSIDAICTDPPAGIGFMGKAWDGDKGGRAQWIAWLTERMRVALTLLKPGGHALVWAIPRTSHWTATALEEAGFEIRDIVMHLFGTGFPKSLDVSKAIDAKVGAARPVVGTRKGTGSTTFAGEVDGKGLGPVVTMTAPGSPEAAQWEGWGTALKPAAEHWILARKPLDGTVAANVLTHGTGGLNIDACRIGYDAAGPPAAVFSGRKGDSEGQLYGASGRYLSNVSEIGRWPANVTLDEEAAAMLDEQSGYQRDGVAVNRNRRPDKPRAETPALMMHSNEARPDQGYGGGGGASRFFYVAKAPRSEKDAGLDHLPVRSGGEATDREEGSAGLSNPRAGAGRTGGARNFHPTVKSIALMRWLCRLITPPGGTVLDMFTGSGTTAIAALQEGFNFIGTELDRDDDGKPLGYMEIAAGRIRHALTAPAGASEDS